MIKVWVGTCNQYGPSIHKIVDKLKEFVGPGIEIVKDWPLADICVDILIGSPHRKNLVNPIETSYSNEVIARQKYPLCKNAYFFCCNIHNDPFYDEAAKDSVLYASYLDVPKMLNIETTPKNFLRIPLGVDPSDFLLPLNSHHKKYLCYAWGASYDPEDEYIETLYKACKLAGGKLLHSGNNYKFDNGENYVFVTRAAVADDVATRYALSWFANAMRREDGFEFSNIEAPLSNCIPIALNKDCYRNWFDYPGSATVFVDPGDVDGLAEILSNKEKLHDKITVGLKRTIIEKFNWITICNTFWEAILENIDE